MSLQEIYLLSRIHSQSASAFLASLRGDKLDADLARLRSLGEGKSKAEGLSLDTPLCEEPGASLGELVNFIASRLNRLFPWRPSLNSQKIFVSPSFYVPVRVVKGR